MGATTTIPWCDHTFNGWRGCVQVSPGCEHCYAEALSHRNPTIFGKWGKAGTRVVAADSTWCQPHAWDGAAKLAGERRRVFSASLSDWLEDWDGPLVDAQGRSLRTWCGEWPWIAVTPASPLREGQRLVTLRDARARLLWTIAMTPHLDWLLLTKRPERWATALSQAPRTPGCDGMIRWWLVGELPDNVWVGASVEDQRRADERIPALQAIPAKVRFLSIEPILGPVDLLSQDKNYATFNVWERKAIDWVIVGGESGPRHRPCEVEWITDVVKQCRRACVPVFVKQDSGLKPERQGRIPDWAWRHREVPDG